MSGGNQPTGKTGGVGDFEAGVKNGGGGVTRRKGGIMRNKTFRTEKPSQGHKPKNDLMGDSEDSQDEDDNEDEEDSLKSDIHTVELNEYDS